MKAALQAFQMRLLQDGDRLEAVRAAAEAVARDPWAVVEHAGLLARAEVTTAPQDLGLTTGLGTCEPGSDHALVRVPRGAPMPALGEGRRRRGAFDTPRELARSLVGHARAASQRRVRTALDPSCGGGAFLVAASEAGIEVLQGSDLDPAALAVAAVAAPHARLEQACALSDGPPADLVLGNPPFVPPERQDKALRRRLRKELPWLRGRYDLAVPMAHRAVARVHPGGAAGLVLPHGLFVQPYGEGLRRHWFGHHRFHLLEGPRRFPGAGVKVVNAVLVKDAGPGPIPPHGTDAAEVLALPRAAWSPLLEPGDALLLHHVRAKSVPLGELALVDTGLVAHGPKGPKARLLRATPRPGCVPFADASDFFAGRRRWLLWRPDEMHRPKSAKHFQAPKIVLQRISGGDPSRAAIDRDGIHVGHTCTVVVPHDDRVPIERLLSLIRAPLVRALGRLERGDGLDFYPADVAAVPVPRAWMDDPGLDLPEAWGLSALQRRRLERLTAS